MLKTITLFIIVALLLTQVQPGQTADNKSLNEALQFFTEEAQVITASHRAQSVSEVPVAVDVITAEDIRASGAVNIWDLLRFRAGMDVLEARSVDGNRAAVSMRGLP